MRLGLESWAAGPSDPTDIPTRITPGGFDAPTPEEINSLFPNLEIQELLGKGGMGAVYKARQVSLDRLVAVKVIRPQSAEDPGFAERFAREARALARLNHPGIITVHDFGHVEYGSRRLTAEGQAAASPDAGATPLYYFVMEYVEGANLRDLLRDGALEAPQALALVPTLCEALQYAHEEGIVHRDIKPENILIDRKGRVKVADFGLAKLIGRRPEDVTLTGAYQAMGTLHYMAPEQLERPLEVDHRADIYALGVTLYEMLTGELPLGRFAPPSSKVRIDVRLDEVVLKALSRDPNERFQHASDIKAEVERISIGDVKSLRWRAANAAESRNEFHPGSGPKLLALALGLLFGATLTLAGLALMALGMTYEPDEGGRWAFLGGGGGTLLGGLGSLFGVWNNYRQFRGQPDWMHAPGWIWLDTMFVVVAVAGLAMLATGALNWSGLGAPAATLLLIFGGIFTLQGAFGGLWRHALRTAAQRGPGEPALDLRLILVALGMLGGGLTMTAGIALGVIAVVYRPGGPEMIGGWIGTVCGLVCGGAGALFGSWNSYRQMEGVPDVWQSGDVTWFDRAIVVAGFVSVLLIAPFLIRPSGWHESLTWGLALVGIIVLFQAVLFGVMRALTMRGARQERDAKRALRDLSVPPSGVSGSDGANSAAVPAEARSTLGKAWHDWWSERDAWVTNAVVAVLVVAHLVCFFGFFAVHSKADWDPEGRRRFTWAVGSPEPWFHFETRPTPKIYFTHGFDILATSNLFLVAGSALAWLMWRIEKVRRPVLRWWNNPLMLMLVWLVIALVAVLAGTKIGLKAVDEQRTAAAQIKGDAMLEARPTSSQGRRFGRATSTAVEPTRCFSTMQLSATRRFLHWLSPRTCSC